MVQRGNDEVFNLFLAAVGTAGGLQEMAREHRLAWLPSLMESACILLMQEHDHRSLEEIAEHLGLDREQVENVLAGPSDSAPQQAHGAPPQDLLAREHLAGGVVRNAYQGMR